MAGETPDTDTLLTMCGRAVDRVARNRRLVLIDGVGFPAVGSICGTDNAQVCIACSSNDRSSPMGVVLVGGVGVGGAVDAYNLNATYFRAAKVPILGAIFNKLPKDGFYSLENCREQVSSYFHQYGGNNEEVFGFVPKFLEIAGPNGMDHVDEFIASFDTHVNIEAILEAARNVSWSSATTTSGPSNKRRRTETSSKRPTSLKKALVRSRKEIEGTAIRSGAQKSA